METLPQDIRNLPTYSVPKELFICTTVLLIVMLAGAITLLTVWIVRSCKHIYNYEYISNHEIKVLMEKKLQQIRVDDEQVLNEEGMTQSQQSVYKEEIELKYREYNRNESRALEFICLSPIVVICMNAYASKVFLLVVFVAAGVCFVLFNILRVKEERALLRYLFYLPLLIAYIPFYLTKSLDS